MRETRVQFLGQEDLLEKEMATHSNILAWKIPWMENLVGYSPWGCKESDTTERLHFLSCYSSFWRRKWQPTPVFLPGESHGRRGLVGYGLWGCKESDMTEQLTHTHTGGFELKIWWKQSFLSPLKCTQTTNWALDFRGLLDTTLPPQPQTLICWSPGLSVI